MKSKTIKIISTLSIIILLLIVGVFITYKIYFAPKTEVVPLSKEVNITNKYLIKKFLPNNFNLSLKEVYVESNTNFSEGELTDLFIYGLKEIPEVQEFLTGLKVDIVDNKINIYIQGKYKSIPLEGALIFSAYAEGGRGIFHYEGGKLGFINISKDMIFKNLTSTSVIDFNKENGDIILSFKGIDELEVRNISTIPDGINLVFRGTIKFWSLLKN